MTSSTIKYMSVALAVSLLAGCSSNDTKDQNPDAGFFQDKLVKYQVSKTMPKLQIPSHLQSTTGELEDIYPVSKTDETGSVSERYGRAPRPVFFYAEVGNNQVQMDRKDGEKFISVEESKDKVWPRVVQYFSYNGIKLDKKDFNDGIIETDWLVRNDEAPGFIDEMLSYIYLTSDQRTADKLRVKLTTVENGRTQISVQHAAVNIKTYEEGDAKADWGDDTTLSYKNRVMYELLSFLSSAKDDQSAISYLQQQRAQQHHEALMGQNERGNPVLMLQTSMTNAWNSLNKALDDNHFDVGTRDKETAKIYLTYTTTLKFEQKSKGFFEWLHSDKEPITLDSDLISNALGLGNKEKEKKISYSSEGNTDVDSASADADPLAKMDGYKIWLGGRVLYVFRKDGDNVGFWDNKTGTYKHTGRYQLHMTRTRKGVLISVYDEKGELANPQVAEEMLWKLKTTIAGQ
ncbi:outer membrane protein assembly factor BamC [Pokkaliibacter sp. CJK22405]|uniref:outer membrane protein assembly factor BamC n=1 Tax=Pokkaliibacter sp. CJK22405 TaxID=3384615 RepID=UPI003984F726